MNLPLGALSVFGLSFIAAGRLQDKKVPFWISVAGSVLFSLGWVLATYANLVTLYLTMGVVLGIGSGFGYAARLRGVCVDSTREVREEAG
jgi:hypothetical protein